MAISAAEFTRWLQTRNKRRYAGVEPMRNSVQGGKRRTVRELLPLPARPAAW